MSKAIPFTKMHGCGNDYVYIDGFRHEIDDPSALSRAVSDRHFGIGGDGLIIISPSGVADMKFRVFNADGSEAEMCGNGIRCAARLAFDRGLVQKKEMAIETKAGARHVVLNDGGDVRVDMGVPVVGEKFEVNGETGRGISVGNPHFVIVRPCIDDLDLERIGPAFENAPVFRDRTNTEFIKVLDRDNLQMRVWERGAGETMACGTGAGASFAACREDGLVGDAATVHLRGGDLNFEWIGGRIFMTGNAVYVFSGEYEL